METIFDIAPKVHEWSKERGLEQADPTKQRLKLREEFGELNAGLAKNKHDVVLDSIGDIVVVLIIYCQQMGIAFTDMDELYQSHRQVIAEDHLDEIALMDDLAYNIGLLGITNKIEFARSFMARILAQLSLLSRLKNTTLSNCLLLAYAEISERKGKMVNGVFVKEGDL